MRAKKSRRCTFIREGCKGTNIFITDASPISSSRQSEIAHSVYRQIFYYIRYASGENTLSEHVNYAPGQSPGHRPLRICRVSRISVPYMLGKRECWSLTALTPFSLTHHRHRNVQSVHCRFCAMISVNYCGRRGEYVRASVSLRPLRHTAEKQREYSRTN